VQRGSGAAASWGELVQVTEIAAYLHSNALFIPLSQIRWVVANMKQLQGSSLSTCAVTLPTKLFCSDIRIRRSSEHQISPCVSAHPGTLPMMNRKSKLNSAIKLGDLFLHCDIERNNYFTLKIHFIPTRLRDTRILTAYNAK